MSRLAERLTAMAPPPLDLLPSTIVRQSPAVAAALTTSAAIATPLRTPAEAVICESYCNLWAAFRPSEAAR